MYLDRTRLVQKSSHSRTLKALMQHFIFHRLVTVHYKHLSCFILLNILLQIWHFGMQILTLLNIHFNHWFHKLIYIHVTSWIFFHIEISGNKIRAVSVQLSPWYLYPGFHLFIFILKKRQVAKFMAYTSCDVKCLLINNFLHWYDRFWPPVFWAVTLGQYPHISAINVMNQLRF